MYAKETPTCGVHCFENPELSGKNAYRSSAAPSLHIATEK